MNIERKTKGLAVLSLVLVAAIASGILLTTQAASAAANEDNLQSTLNTQLAAVTTPVSDTTASAGNVTGDAPTAVPFWGEGPMGFGRHGRGFGGMCGGFGPIEVSDEYKTAAPVYWPVVGYHLHRPDAAVFCLVFALKPSVPIPHELLDMGSGFLRTFSRLHIGNPHR